MLKARQLQRYTQTVTNMKGHWQQQFEKLSEAARKTSAEFDSLRDTLNNMNKLRRNKLGGAYRIPPDQPINTSLFEEAIIIHETINQVTYGCDYSRVCS